jgi:hypothetical protein
MIGYWTRWDSKPFYLFFYIFVIQALIILERSKSLSYFLGYLTCLWIVEKFYHIKKKKKIELMLEVNGVGKKVM